MTASDTERYKRQTILPEIGSEGQIRLAQARALVVGAGGLGCPALLYLAGAGIGTIGIVDYDKVDISNLQRQILFVSENENQPKALAAQSRLTALNPSITIHAYQEELTEQNVLELFSAYDIIIDGTDNFAAKFLINDAAVKSGKPVVYGAIQGFEGQVSVFDAARGPCYRCLYPQPPNAHIINCAESGVVGALAGIVGTMQAMEAIKWIVGHASFKPLIGKLCLIDARTMAVNSLGIPKQKDCPVCAQPTDKIVLEYISPTCSAAPVIEVRPDDLASMQNIILIDVREREEWDHGHIPGARHAPLSDLRNNPKAFDAVRTQHYVLYCQRGSRSRQAAEILLRAGFQHIYSLQGGYSAWQDNRLP